MKYEDKIQTVTERCNILESKAMKNELIIFGLQDSNVACIKTAKKFFTKQMEIQNVPEIIYAYWKGKNNHKPLVVKLPAIQQRESSSKMSQN